MKQKKIGVVGGGLSGMVAARTLHEKGHEVTVFERGRRIVFENGSTVDPPVYDASVGGKCCSPRINTHSFEMGACSCSPEFKTVIQLARLTDTRLRVRMPFRVVTGAGQKKCFRKEYWPSGQNLRILGQSLAYLWHAFAFRMRCDRNLGYRRIAKPYQDSFSVFCSKKSLSIVQHWFDLPVTSFGYGKLDAIPAWFVLDYINPVNFLGLAFLLILFDIPPVRRFDEGFEALVEKLSAGLDVRRRHQVVGIRRDPQVRIQVKELDTGQMSDHHFDAVVISPPLPRMLPAMDADAEETAIAGAITVRPYTVAACSIPDIDNECLLLRDNLNRPGHLALIEETVPGENGLCVCYIPENSHERKLDEIMEGLAQDVRAAGFRLARIHAVKQWSYFPHFKDSRWYARLQHLQGRRNTYYLGALSTFELSERVAAHAQALMDSSFEGDMPKEALTTLKNLVYFYCKARRL